MQSAKGWTSSWKPAWADLLACGSAAAGLAGEPIEHSSSRGDELAANVLFCLIRTGEKLIQSRETIAVTVRSGI